MIKKIKEFFTRKGKSKTEVAAIVDDIDSAVNAAANILEEVEPKQQEPKQQELKESQNQSYKDHQKKQKSQSRARQ